jgi:hypothetical protein
MNDIRLILLLVVSSLIGALGGLCITLLPLFLLMFAAGDSGRIDLVFAGFFFLLFIIEFTIAGSLAAIVMRGFVGSHLMSIKDGAIRFTIGSLIGGLIILFISIENFFEIAALASLITVTLGVTLCWLKLRANEKELGPETLTTLKIQ